MKSSWSDRRKILIEAWQDTKPNTLERFDAVGKSGLLDMPFDRYVRSIEWYCENEEYRKDSQEDGISGPLLFNDEFREDLLLLLHTPLWWLNCEEDNRLNRLPGDGYDLIQTLHFGICAIARHTPDVAEAKECKNLDEILDQLRYETGALGTIDGVPERIVRLIQRKAEECGFVQSKASVVSERIKPPDMADVDDCKRFLREVYILLRKHYQTRIHSESEAVNYLLIEAKTGDAYFELCKTSRDIKESYNWERGTFMTYCKQKPPKPKGLKVAAKARAKKRHVARDLGGV